MVSVAEHVVDYCKRWEVNVEVIPSQHFINLQSDNKFNKNPFNGTAIYSTYNSKIIYVDENDKVTKNPIEDKVLHELAHIVMRVTPKFINEFKSPFFAMWYKMMEKNNSKHRIFHDPVIQKNLDFAISKIESFMPELIKHGLIKETGEHSFIYDKVKPQKSWLN